MKNDMHDDYLTGRFLASTPQILDPRFERVLIYVCGHDAKGSMGLVVNRLLPDIDLVQLAEQLDLEVGDAKVNLPIFEGGPVEMSRGFILHTSDYHQDSTVKIHGNISMTATLEILRAIARGEGPKEALIAMGYAGWGPGQLDLEMHASGWLLIEGGEDLLFRTPVEQRWHKALSKLGIDVATLSDTMGRA